MKSDSLEPRPEAARTFAFDEVDLDAAGKGLSSTWQMVPAAGSVPFAKNARVLWMVHFEVSAVEVCYS